ncbi:LPXTG cell wall anchor domain-containing protein, partial [Streptococcus uberis]|uniref:LPXTG cell wall anchor domain-containing protein n=5 Tax=Streptococcus uberis TaxID=1349 RepID=UPI0020C02B00
EDGSDETPKAFTDLTATATPVTVPEGQAVPADTKVVETNKSDAVISSTPTNGLSVDENGNLVGTPTVDDWGTDEETREVKVPVKVTNTLPDGTEEVVEVEVPVTVNRDTDGDGIIDSEDPDDDNDGVEDGSDETPKAFTDLTATATPVTVPEGQAVPADTKVNTLPLTGDSSEAFFTSAALAIISSVGLLGIAKGKKNGSD